MALETFKPTQAAAAADNTHLVGDTWSKPAKVEAKAGDDSLKAADTNAPAAEKAQQTDKAPEKQQFTPEQVKDASEGKMSDAARQQFLEALQKGGLPGLVKAAEALNKQLEQAGSPYRMSFAGAINQGTGEVTIGMALTTPNENHGAIIADIMKNGSNSQYYGRGFKIQLNPSRPGQDI